ncbi:MAG: hypothetical protein SVM80_13695, partial [Halobacteriota archaeon]|nr:hypothetical protein [Halobacteriota archaeon]
MTKTESVKSLEDFMNEEVDEGMYKGVYKFRIETVEVKTSEEIFGDKSMDDGCHLVFSDGVSNINLKLPSGIGHNGEKFVITDEKKAQKSRTIGKASFWKFINQYGYPRTGLEVDVKINE